MRETHELEFTTDELCSIIAAVAAVASDAPTDHSHHEIFKSIHSKAFEALGIQKHLKEFQRAIQPQA